MMVPVGVPGNRLPEAGSEQTDGCFPLRLQRPRRRRGSHFLCPDTRTLAHFSVEPVDLSDSEFCAPYYRRAIVILEKIEAEPGIKTDEILGRFTEFEREEISPPLTPVLVEVLLEALSDMDYIKIKDGKRTPRAGSRPADQRLASRMVLLPGREEVHDESRPRSLDMVAA